MSRTSWWAGVAACGLLAACGSSTGTTDGVAAAPESSSPESSSPDSAPTAAPYPEFGPTDYTYVLRVSCFCADRGAVVVTVQDGQVTSAVERRTGEDAPEYRRLSINDVIDAANKAEADDAARVDVRWPEGLDHPTSVYIDQDEMMADEEIGYAVRDVQVTTG